VSAVTHLVTSVNAEGSCPRTIKFLQAVLAGIWILDFRCTLALNVSTDVVSSQFGLVIALQRCSSRQFVDVNFLLHFTALNDEYSLNPGFQK